MKTIRPCFLNRNVLLFIPLILASILLIACQNNSGTDSTLNTTTGSGSVAVLIADAPSDYFTEINLHITKVELFSFDDTRTTLFSGSRTINLLDVATHTDLLSFTDSVPSGEYKKIRFTLADIALIKKDADGVIIEEAHPKLPGNGKVDLIPDDTFSVITGETIIIHADWDADKSIHITKTGNGGYNFRPVVFVDIHTDTLPGRMIRLQGRIQSINKDTQSFELCTTNDLFHHSEHDDDHKDHDETHCVKVNIVEGTVYFDADGNPVGFDQLKEGFEGSVIGNIDTISHHHDESGHDDDNSHDNEAISSDHDENHGDDGDHNGHKQITINAEIVILGPLNTILQLTGTVNSVIDTTTDQFGMTLDSGQGFIENTHIQVQLQHGTILRNKNGDPLDTSSIVPGKSVVINGMIMLSDSTPDTIKAISVFIDTMATSSQMLSGTILVFHDPRDGFDISTDSGDRCIKLDDDAELFAVTSNSEKFESQKINFGNLSQGQSADFFGHEDTVSGCFIAEDIIADAN